MGCFSKADSSTKQLIVDKTIQITNKVLPSHYPKKKQQTLINTLSVQICNSAKLTAKRRGPQIPKVGTDFHQ